MTRYLSVQEIIVINTEAVRRFGGTYGIRDAGALEAAVGRPQTGYYKDIVEEAAALFESLSQNHPFIDGNKRTAITATAVFLMTNGYKLSFDESEMYTWLMHLYETGKVTKTAMEAWLRQHCRHM